MCFSCKIVSCACEFCFIAIVTNSNFFRCINRYSRITYYCNIHAQAAEQVCQLTSRLVGLSYSDHSMVS